MAWITIVSQHLTDSQMENNANIIGYKLRDAGYSIGAAAGILGNMQAESSINPGRWQNDNIGIWSAGLGLIQWTPATILQDYAADHGADIYSGNLQVNLVRAELEGGKPGYYYATSDYPISAANYITSTASPEYLASAYLYNRERPADPSASEQERRQAARHWYNYLSGNPPRIEDDQPYVPPDPPGPSGPFWPENPLPEYVKKAIAARCIRDRRKGGYILGLSDILK